MLDTSARLLRLLSLLQTRPDWPGPELAGRLEITPRTLRRDIQRLRDLGYPVHATPGVAGGYRLAPGATLPPLLLTDDEAVAVAVSLRTAASQSVTGIAETALTALAKLEQVLPTRLRQRTEALHQATVTLPRTAPTVDPALLTTLATACRHHQALTIAYTTRDGAETERQIEPHRLVHTGYRWYLVARDTTRDALPHLPRRPHHQSDPHRREIRPPRPTRRRHLRSPRRHHRPVPLSSPRLDPRPAPHRGRPGHAHHRHPRGNRPRPMLLTSG